MNDNLDKYTYYLTMSLIVVFFATIFILVCMFIAGYMCVISTGGVI